MQVEICECKISELLLLHGGDYMYILTVGSITVFCMTVKLHFVLLRTEHSTVRRRLVPAVERFKTQVCGRSPAEIVGSNSAGGMDVCLFCVLCVVR